MADRGRPFKRNYNESPVIASDQQIPPEFQPNKNREPGSSLYEFTKDFSLRSYVPKNIRL